LFVRNNAQGNNRKHGQTHQSQARHVRHWQMFFPSELL
jgi:hypothetical protein